MGEGASTLEYPGVGAVTGALDLWVAAGAGVVAWIDNDRLLPSEYERQPTLICLSLWRMAMSFGQGTSSGAGGGATLDALSYWE